MKAIVISSEDNFKTVCMTEIDDGGFWVCGMNLITSLEDAVQQAHKAQIPIYFEEMLPEGAVR